jgi:hypothetical protein
VIQTVKQGLEDEGVKVPMTRLCQWFEVPRRSVYYKPIKSAPKVQERLETPCSHPRQVDSLIADRSADLGFCQV